MNGGRLLCWLTAIASLALIAIASVVMADRINASNINDPKPFYLFRNVDVNSGELFHGRQVLFTQTLDDVGLGTVRIYYGQDTLELPVAIPSKYDIPGIERHEDWLKVLDFADAVGMDIEQFRAGIDSGEIPMRRVAVTRSLPEGANPETYGRVKRTEWLFNFYEFLPSGGFEHLQLTFPESERSFQARAGMAELQGNPIERRDTEIKEHTWQFNAAMQVMPAGSAPKHTFNRSALKKAGWTLPAIAMSFITLLFSVALAFAPPRREMPADANADADADAKA